MSTDHQTDAVPPAAAGRLQSLLDALQQLYFQVAARFWHSRLQQPDGARAAGERSDIAGSLDSHLERTAEQARQEAAQRAEAGERQPLETTGNGRRKGLGGRILGALAAPLQRRRHGADLRPHMKEKMQATTLSHINRALRLARQGNDQGARVYVGLAESAMETASRYMEKAEYSQFKEEVETRLKAVTGSPR